MRLSAPSPDPGRPGAPVLASLLGLAALFGAGPLAADAPKRDWSVAPVLGLYQPSLSDLNQGEFLATISGDAELIDQSSVNVSDSGIPSPTEPFTYPIPLDPLPAGTTAALEFQWRFDDRHTLLIGGSTWEASSQTLIRRPFPMQGFFVETEATRKHKVSFTELFFGWRYDLQQRRDRHVYLRLSLHDMFDIDQREDFSFFFLEGRPKGVRKSIIIQSQATGALLLQTGLGGEWFVTNWLSLSLEANYAYGLNEVVLRDGSVNVDFRDSDNVALKSPLKPENPPEGRFDMQYKLPDDSYKTLRLDFSGWKALAKVSIHY